MTIYLVCAGTLKGDILPVERYTTKADADALAERLSHPDLAEARAAFNVDAIWVESQEIVDAPA